MAIVGTALASAYFGTDAVEASTATVTPTSTALQLIGVTSSRATDNPSVPSAVTGCGLTWVQVATVLWRSASAANYRTTVFRARGTASTGSLSLQFGSETQTAISHVWAEFSDTSSSGTDGAGAVAQVVTSNGTADPTGDVTFAGFTDNVNNAGVVFTSANANTTITEDTGWTEWASVVGTVPATVCNGAWHLGEELVVTSTFGASVGSWGMIGIEVASGATAPTRPFINVTIGG